MKKFGAWCATLMAAGTLWAVDPSLTLNRVQQRYPWNGKVDIDYTVANVPAGSESDYYVRFKVTENGRTRVIHSIVDYSTLFEASNGTYRVTWDSAKESSEYWFLDKNASVKGEVVFCENDRSNVPYGDCYAIIDLSGGASATSYPVSYERIGYDAATNRFAASEYKTDKLVLREIRAGSFMMGSPETEWGREPVIYFNSERQHQVTLTRNFLIGIFPVTQTQYEKVMGSNPSQHTGSDSDSNPAAERPVDSVSYSMIRGSSVGVSRPATFGKTDSNSFCGVLSAKTGLTIDLPTEAEWEYACRAGTTTSTYAGEMTQLNAATLISTIAWFSNNSANITHAVGQKLSNEWGLYDMLGNVWEFVRDRVESAPIPNQTPPKDDPGTDPVTDPLRDTGVNCVGRGGSWQAPADQCRAAIRGADGNADNRRNIYGFRISSRIP